MYKTYYSAKTQLVFLFCGKAVYWVRRNRILQIVGHAQCGKNCKHHKNLALTELAVLQKHKHNYQQKQKPIVVKHTSPLWLFITICVQILQSYNFFAVKFNLECRYGTDRLWHRTNGLGLHSAQRHLTFACRVFLCLLGRNESKDNMRAVHQRNVRERSCKDTFAQSNDMFASA